MHQNNPVFVYIKTETGSLDDENSRSLVCIFPIIQEVFDKSSFSWRPEQRVELAPREISMTGVILSPLLEADIIGYFYLDPLAQ